MTYLKRLFLCALFIFSSVASASAMDHSKMQMGGVEMKGEDHSAHMAMMNSKNSYTEKEALYSVPDVELTDQNGKKVKLQELLKSSEPYALNFIFTTCTTICLILTASFAHMQHELGPDADKLRLISISIDPEYDTPTVLKSYSEKVRATKNWTFLTGNYETIVAVEKAFDSYTSDKMNHRPSYLFKLASQEKWHRVDGLTSGTDLANIYRHLDLF